MPITRTPMVDDDGSGTTGTIINAAWKTELYNQIDGLIGAGGQWTDVVFNASNFYTTDGGTSLTVNTQFTNAYVLFGKMLTWSVFIKGTIVGAPARLYCALPAGLVVARQHFGVNNFFNETTVVSGVGTVDMAASVARVDLLRTFDAQPWTAGSVYLGFTIALSVT
jgi:hypothetical protein